MAKFHISKNGKIARCTATTKPCPLGGAEVHVECGTIEEAQKMFDKKFKEEFCVISKINKKEKNYVKISY